MSEEKCVQVGSNPAELNEPDGEDNGSLSLINATKKLLNDPKLITDVERALANSN